MTSNVNMKILISLTLVLLTTSAFALDSNPNAAASAIYKVEVNSHWLVYGFFDLQDYGDSRKY